MLFVIQYSNGNFVGLIPFKLNFYLFRNKCLFNPVDQRIENIDQWVFDMVVF